MPLIRPARPNDSKQLAALQEQTFRDTYGAVNTPEDMALYCQTHFSVALQESEIMNPEIVTLVCEDGGELIGFTQLRWNTASALDQTKRPIEIQRFYVEKNWHGKGVAQQLMRCAFSFAKELGAQQIWLAVWEHNPRAFQFYRKFDFVLVGETVFTLGTDPQRDIVVAREL